MATVPYSFNLGAAVVGLTGTVSVTAGSDTTTGSGTNFTVFNNAPYNTYTRMLTINGVTRVITYVGSDVFLMAGRPTTGWPMTVSGALYSGLTLTPLEMLGVMLPKATYRPYSQRLTMGDGAVRGAGWPVAEWRWGFLPKAQRDVLRGYCPGASATVCLTLPDVLIGSEAGGYWAQIFTGTMIWPEEERTDAGRYLDFVVRFQALQRVNV